MKKGPLYILSWDGVPPWLLDRARAAGCTPNLDRLLAEGTSAVGSRSDSPDCTTPPSHALLWTGYSARWNGIVSFRAPAWPIEEHSLLETDSGFDARRLLKEPIWTTAGHAGLSSTLVHTPLTYPMSPWERSGPFDCDLTEKAKILFGYANLKVPAWLLRGESGGYDRAWVTLDPAKANRGVLVRAGKAAPFSDRLVLENGSTIALRLFDLAPDGSQLLLFGTDAFEICAFPAKIGRRYDEVLGSFPAGGKYEFLTDGTYGPVYTDGVAEARYMETYTYGMDHFIAAARFALNEHPADLMIFYHPGIDELGHQWAAHLDKELPCYTAAKDAFVWPYFAEGFRKADEHLGVLFDALPPNGTLVVLSDHGVSGICSHFQPNAVLARAGLLTTVPGKPECIDLATTKALFHPACHGYVYVNTERYREGWVPEAEVEEIVEAAHEALMDALDPATGKPVLAAAIRTANLPEDSPFRGPGRGELFLVAKRGCSLGEGTGPAPLVPPFLLGHHQQSPALRQLHAIFATVGPGIRKGGSIGLIDHADIHETFRRILGLAASGGPGEALDRIFED